MTARERTIDLNADLGEGFPWDADLLGRITSANVSCGAHAGDPEGIRRTLELASERGVNVGAHPGYPDRAGFGRRERDMSPSALRDLIVTQVERLAELCAPLGISPRYVKPHGALYNQAQRDGRVAQAVVDAMRTIGLPLVGMPGSVLEQRARGSRIPYVTEGFADRRYGPNGLLLSRSTPGAILGDPGEIEAQLLTLIAAGIETICLHGDNPGAVVQAGLIRGLLDRDGISVRAFHTG